MSEIRQVEKISQNAWMLGKMEIKLVTGQDTGNLGGEYVLWFKGH